MWFKFLISSVLSIVIFTPAVLAKGIVTVEQINGNADDYIDVEIFSNDNTLYLKPADGKNLIVIEKKDCQIEQNIQVCNQGSLTIDTYGVEEEIEIEKLFIFTNTTNQRLPIQKSDVTLNGNTILIEILTTKGTYITGMGRIDANMLPEN